MNSDRPGKLIRCLGVDLCRAVVISAFAVEGMEAAVEAAKLNDVEVLRRLLDEEPGLIEAEDPMPLLCVASASGSLEAAGLLLDRGADIHQMNTTNRLSAFMAACITGRVAMVSFLIQRGADPTRPNGLGVTPLAVAAGAPDGDGADHVAVLRLLLNQPGVDVDAPDQLGCTPLLAASLFGHVERVRVLLLEGLADYNTKVGRTPMDAAQQAGQTECVTLLQWYEGELQRALLLSKARAVVDDTDSITKAPEKVQAKTRAQAQQAREEAAPAWLRGRVVRGEALPVVEVVGQRKRRRREQEEEEERGAVCEWLVRSVPEDLYVEMMEGLTYRRWVPNEGQGLKMDEDQAGSEEKGQ